MTSPDTPTTPQQLTVPWLTSALRKAGHLRAGAVEHLRAESLDATKAAYGTLVRLSLTYSGASDLPPTMIVKLPSPNPAAAAIMRASGGYRTEVRFYQQVGSAIGVRVPACYGAFFDDTTSNFLLLLEDLSQHRSADRAGDLSLRETTAVVAGLATSHAQWWRSERLTTFDWLPPIGADAAWILAQFPGAWPIVTGRFGAALPPGIGDRIARILGPMYERLGRQPVTILHLDVRRENLFFNGPDDNPEPILIDWQSMRAGRGPAALASFLASLPSRAKIEPDLVSLYHSRLTAAGVRDYSFDECLDDYRLGLLRRFIHPACILATVDPDSAQGRNILALLSSFGLERLEWYVDRLEALRGWSR